MPRARTWIGRMHQVENWLQTNHPPPRRTTVRYCKIVKGCYGDVTRHGNALVIRVNSRLPIGIAMTFLFEEWAHAMSWTLAKLEKTTPHHSDEWGLAMAKLYRTYEDEGGNKDSYDYPED